MVKAKFNGTSVTSAYGLTQYDYGRKLIIENAPVEIPDNTEIHFYQGNISCIGKIVSYSVMIPDLMLQYHAKITCYVYVREESSGKTVLTIELPIRERPKPSNYVLPEYDEYTRLLPVGGSEGQYLRNNGVDAEWSDIGDEMATDDELRQVSETVPVSMSVQEILKICK